MSLNRYGKVWKPKPVSFLNSQGVPPAQCCRGPRVRRAGWAVATRLAELPLRVQVTIEEPHPDGACRERVFAGACGMEAGGLHASS